MANLSERIFNLESVRSQIKSTIIESVCESFPTLIWNFDKSELENNIDWNNLLSCASIIHQSNKYEHLDASLRIAQQCLNSNSTNEQQKVAATIILEALTNKPAIKLAIKRELITKEYRNQIPLPFIFEIIKRDFNNSIFGNDSNLIYFNKFQKSVYDSYLLNESISISAPTSSGKSFLLERLILNEINDNANPKSIIYIVPTRALINQVEQEINIVLKENKIKNIYLSTVPQIPDNDSINLNKIFVFTQERLHWFRTELPHYKIDILIVDEAQKIEDGNRGILLQQKIEELVEDFPEIKILFSSPSTSNPEILLENIPNTKTKAFIKTDFVAVNQNLIFISQKYGNPLFWNLKLVTNRELIDLGNINLKFRPTSETKRLVFIVHELGDKNGGNLIYVNGAADAERSSLVLFGSLENEYTEISQEVKDLIQLVKKTVHSKYALAKVLEKKIAFHYGSMPLTIRQEIERLFKKGDIHFLFCTSTLLEGVNLPAKSIFMRRPTRGIRNPLNKSDFWNLAGRAGRWSQEFQGNIICVEPDLWEEKPSIDRSEHRIERALDKLTLKSDDLLNFIKSGTPRESLKDKLDLEYGFTYYYSKFLQNKLNNDDKLNSSLLEAFKPFSETITIPKEIIIRNPGISPLAQQNLFDYFQNYTKEISNLIPVLPESENSAMQSYLPIVQRINKHLSGEFPALAPYHAILIVNWMKGFSLAILISMNISYWSSKNPAKKIDAIIRETMRDIEEYVRFKFAKYSSCYVDILRYHLRVTNKEELLDSIPQLNIWLEFGVSQQTQISLISLGLARNTAITLSEFMASDKLNRKECLEWLKENDLTVYGLSPILLREVENILN